MPARKPSRVQLREIVIGSKRRRMAGTSPVRYWREIIDMATGKPPIAGDVFYYRKGRSAEWLSPAYRKYCSEIGDRDPIVIILPSGQWWNVDSMYFGAQGYYGNGWTVSKITTLSRLSITPSIRTPGYHGIVTNGIMGACEDSPT